MMTRLMALTLIHLTAWLSTCAGAEDPSPKSVGAEWTVARLAEAVESSIDRFERVELEAVYTQTRDVNTFTGKEPLLMKGSGTIHYRGDHDRWYLRDDGFTFRTGVAEPNPITRISGYDGEIHYQGSQDRLTLAETGSRRYGRPRGMIWEPLLTYDYLRRAFDRESTEIVFAGTVDERSVVDLESTWGTATRWKLQARFLADRSFIPSWQRLYKDGKLYADCRTDVITSIKGIDAWYPAIIETKYHQQGLGVVDQQYAIGSLELPTSFDANAFRYEPDSGADVIDRRSNLAWHIDPWWDELMPWLLTELGWPRYKFQSLGDFKSYCEPEIHGAAAPPIVASAWVGQEPGGWDRKGRNFSLLFFWGDATSLGDPFPRWTTELGQLARLVEPVGGEVIGIAGHRTDIDAMRLTAKELMIGIPFAIDGPGDGEGATHTAFHLRHYYSVVLVDEHGKVRLLDEGNDALLKTLGELIPEDSWEAIAAVFAIDASMSRAEHDAIKAHWIGSRRDADGTGAIIGRVDPPTGVTATLLPQMKMLGSSNPGGYMLFQDHRGQMSVDVDQETGSFRFENLPRGLYKLSVARQDGQKAETQITLEDDDLQMSQSFSLR